MFEKLTGSVTGDTEISALAGTYGHSSVLDGDLPAIGLTLLALAMLGVKAWQWLRRARAGTA